MPMPLFASCLVNADMFLPCLHHTHRPHLPPRPPQVLGVGADTGCSVPSVLLFFDRQRFLFNAGEGFQRFCVEHRVKLAKVSAVLATRTTTEATGGLPGALGGHCCRWQGWQPGCVLRCGLRV